ncbi:hypothetical protein ACQJBY_040446 [Aegilops geniculata]
MAISKKNASFVCLGALMLVMATIMLSCDADPKERCYEIEDGCDETKCMENCVGTGHTKGFHCRDVGECCCLIAAKTNVDVIHRHD